MGIKPKTAGLLGMIYVKYWANEEEKQEFMRKANENEQIYQEELRAKFNLNDIFKTEKNNKIKETKNENLPMVNEENVNFFMKIWNKLKNFLNIKS